MANEELRRRILETAYHAREGHVPSALSIVDIIWTLYDQVMGLPVTKIDQGGSAWADLSLQNWAEPHADQFVLSKGHAALALYAVLEAKGFLLPELMTKFCTLGGKLGGHPDAHKMPGVWVSTGSLGHGLPFAVGMAYAKRVRGEKGRVFCLVGDGEMQEGSALEALRFVQQLDCANLCLIVDANDTHGKVTALASVLRAYEFHVRIVEGHDPQWLAPALGNYSTYPVAVLARTTKGKGIKAMERDPQAWHRRVPTAEEFREMMEALT